jgi:thiol-disulfide isomerase/thioredoxin
MNFFKQILLCVLLICFNISKAQKIAGKFNALANQKIVLEVFTNLEANAIDSVLSDDKGKFTLTYNAAHYGMGQISVGEEQSLVVYLGAKGLQLAGKNFKQIDSLEVLKSKENQALYTHQTQYPQRQMVMSAWQFLQNEYAQKPFLTENKNTSTLIAKNLKELKTQDQRFLNDLPNNSYMRWYLPTKTLLTKVGNIARNKPEKIPETKAALYALDFTDERFYNSGLLKSALFNTVWFVENTEGTLPQVFAALNNYIDTVASSLKNEDTYFNLVMDELFRILEERSLFTSSEYLAEKLLQGDDCGCLNLELSKKLERYGKMAQGQTAPNIEFGDFTYYPPEVKAKNLRQLKADYKLVVFAAYWCPHCREAMPKIEELHQDFEEKGLEVVFVSLDKNPQDFARFAAPLPFVSTTDYKKWEGQAVADYQVYATPTYFILDKDLKILVRPKSVEHARAWLKQFAI